MWAALLLGLTGSLGHCIGMCSGVALLLGRRGGAEGWRVMFLHLGRVTTYALLGAVAGGIGMAIVTALSYCAAPFTNSISPNNGLSALIRLQGVLALLTAVLSLYMALALLGRLPSPEIYFMGLTKRWGRLMRRLTRPVPAKEETAVSSDSGILNLWALGMLWGLLPCGLVLTALVAAAVAGSPQLGALTMLAFGIGTWPVNVGVSVIGRFKNKNLQQAAQPYFRYAAATIVMIFGLQMALRGLAAWGWVGHYHVGTIMLW